VLLTGAVTIGALLAALLGDLAGPRSASWAATLILVLVWIPVFASPLRHARVLTPTIEPAITGIS